MSNPKTDGTSIQVIGRMFSLLDTLAHEGDAMSLKLISEQTGLHPPPPTASSMTSPWAAWSSARGLAPTAWASGC